MMTAKESAVTPAQLRKLIRYEPETGQMFWLSRTIETFPGTTHGHSPEWRVNNWNAAHAEKEIASRGRYGYITVHIRKYMYQGHRVAWAIFYGKWPEGHLDHINGVRDDNRIANLRLSSPTLNARNMALAGHNTSGVTGVSYSKRDDRWSAKIGVNMRDVHLGNFRTIDEAAAARKGAEVILGFSRRHGKPA